MVVTWKAGSRGNSLSRLAIAIPWFNKSEYPTLQRIVNDARAMPRDFEQWKKDAELLERNWKRKGHLTVRVVVEPDIFVRYCAARSKEPCGNLLTDFAYAWIEAGKRVGV